MDQTLMHFFHREIQEQCAYALEGFELLDGCIASNGKPVADPWFPLSIILNASANISKLGWGSGQKKKKATEDRKDFRALYSLDKDSPVYDTQVRNRLEHIDERIETGLARGGAMSMRNVAPIGTFNVGDPGLFLHYDQQAGRVYFGIDQSVDLASLKLEVERLREIASAK